MRSWFGSAALALALFVAPVRAAGPFDIPLFATPKAPAATGSARLVFAESPFGVAMTADGHARYDVQITAANLPAPSSLGAYHAYVAWAVTSDLVHWQRLGAVTNGRSTVGHIALDKFLLVIAAEADSAATTHSGPSVLHGNSPSSWLQTFLAHSAFFHGVTD
jgi:hypothetical protein